MDSLFLFQIGIFKIEFSTIISFLVGVLMGFIILLLVYALAVVSSMKTKNFFTKTDSDDLTTTEVKDMVARTQKSYKDKDLRGELSRVPHCYKLCKDLAYGIAVRYYPKSKYPFLELSINELTLLTGYITSRVNEILNHRGIRMLRKLKVSTIVNLSNRKKEIEESKAFQATKTISQNLSKAKYVLNLINPITWGRKFIVDRILNIVIDQICLAVISIVGEETYKIYSKKVFNTDVDIDTGTEELLEEMTDSIKNAVMEIEDSEPRYEKADGYRLKSKIYIAKETKEKKRTYDVKFPLKSKMEVILDEKEEYSED
ncbi:MAG: hypothetical protein K2I42_03010 [Anaeroplasmataceae bacterium]|nr:hypothetical protein [Anaeroplasmataceae bacterium]